MNEDRYINGQVLMGETCILLGNCFCRKMIEQ